MRTISNSRKICQNLWRSFFSTYLDEESMIKVLEKCPFPKEANLSVPKLDEHWRINSYPIFFSLRKGTGGGGGVRRMINLKYLKQNILHEYFKMENMSDLVNMIQTGDFMMKLDLKDACFRVPIHPLDQKFLRFRWKGKLYQVLVMAFMDSSFKSCIIAQIRIHHKMS